MTLFQGKYFVAVSGAFLGVLGKRYSRLTSQITTLHNFQGLTLYPIIIAPMMNPEPWKQMSEDARKRANIKQEDIQPGNMKVWTDPFDRPGKPGNK